MDTLNALKQYYESYDEQGRLDTGCGLVEFLTTMRYIDRYLKPGMRVLEIGAATGRYSHHIARMGFHVDAVELLEHNIDLFCSNTVAGEMVTVTQGDAKDLSFVQDQTYDLTLLLGPMYHLFSLEDKMQALSEAIRVTKTGGIIFVAYCMADPSIVQYGFGKGRIHDLIDENLIDAETFETYSRPLDLFELHTKAKIDEMRRQFSVTQLHFVATDGYACHMRPVLAQMDEETYSLYLRYHLATCERQDLIGFSNHTLDIFRKDG